MTFPSAPQKIIPFKGKKPLENHELERQFDEQNRAITRVIEFLRTIVRDDGKLRNGLIEPEQLGEETPKELAKKVLQELEGLLETTKQSVREAINAAGEARTIVAKIHDRERQISQSAEAMSAAAELVRERLQAMQTLAPPSSPAAPPALPTGVLGPNAGGFYGVDTGAAPTAQDWAQVSIEWAEHMPDTIPPNILATNAITGQHWSSRWWAMKSANAFGALAAWYQGAWPQPGPPSTPLTATGDPIPVGGMYYDTTLGSMMIWTGSTWVNVTAPQKAALATLYYQASPGQSIFPLTALDRFGKNFAYDQQYPEGTMVFVNGVRLEPTYDYVVDIPSSTVTTLRPLTGGSIVTFDLLTPASRLAPAGSANTVLVSQITPDGTTTTFNLTVAHDLQPTSVSRNEELLVVVDGVQQAPGAQYTALGDTLTFAEAPGADSLVFIIWFGPSTEAGGAAGVIQVIGKMPSVNWGVVADIPVPLASHKCLPLYALNTNFSGDLGNSDGGASVYPQPNAGGQNFGPGCVGPYLNVGGAPGMPLATAATMVPFTSNNQFLPTVYINIDTADSASPPPMSDVYIIGIDLSVL